MAKTAPAGSAKKSMKKTATATAAAKTGTDVKGRSGEKKTAPKTGKKK